MSKVRDIMGRDLYVFPPYIGVCEPNHMGYAQHPRTLLSASPHALLLLFELAFLEPSQRLGRELKGRECKIVSNIEMLWMGVHAKRTVRE